MAGLTSCSEVGIHTLMDADKVCDDGEVVDEVDKENAIPAVPPELLDTYS